MHRSTIRRFALLACLSTLGVACTSGSGVGEAPRDSFWLPSAKEAFVTIVNDTSYTIVPDETHDVLIHEQETGKKGRLTWIVRVPRGAAMGVAHRIGGEGSPVRGWMLEQVEGEASTLVPAAGSVVLHARTLDSTSATVVLEAETTPVSAGSVLSGVTRLTVRDSWSRVVREPNYLVERGTRSGAPEHHSQSSDERFFGGDGDIKFVGDREGR